MAKRCEEEFNPWPPFVDVFSSVILVMMLFLLVTIVNISYYVQFKFKVSYSGTVQPTEMILQQEPPKPQDIVVVQKRIEQIVEEPETKQEIGTIESAGKDLSRIYEDEYTKQVTVATEQYMIVNYGGPDIKIDNPIILEIKSFIQSSKEKYPRHIVKINSVDPTNQISATVMKQISLARTLNVRNLIRQLGYDIKDVQVDLLKNDPLVNENKNPNGFIVIRIESK